MGKKEKKCRQDFVYVCQEQKYGYPPKPAYKHPTPKPAYSPTPKPPYGGTPKPAYGVTPVPHPAHAPTPSPHHGTYSYVIIKALHPTTVAPLPIYGHSTT